MTVPIRLLILGLLAQKERHGYEIGSLAKSFGMNRWSGFGPGSLYHALSALEKSGDVVRGRTEQRGRYPARSIYAITRQGRDTVGRLLVEAGQEVQFEDAIDLVLSFLPLVPAEERRQLLELRLGLLVSARKEAEHALGRQRDAGAEPWVLAPLERRVAMCRAQTEWLIHLLDVVGGWKAKGHPERGHGR
jgi:DNA-binding PadR family transcriptional regulator